MDNEKKTMKKEGGLGYVLKLLRIANEMSAVDLAKKMGVSSSFINEIESNKKKPSLDTLSKYSEALKISRSDILYFDDEGQRQGYNYQDLLIRILQKIQEIN